MEMSDQQNVTGGPGTPMETAAATPAATAPQQQATHNQPIYVNGRAFNTVEELAAYTSQIEAQTLRTQTQQPVTQQTVSTHQTVSDDDFDELESKLFDNPKEALKKLAQKIESKVEKKMETKYEQTKRQEEDQKVFWDDFYNVNPDLKNQDRVVKSVLREKFAEIGRLPVAQAKEQLAKEARQWITQVRGTSETRATVMETTRASTLGASNQGTPKVETKPQVMSFSDQVRGLRKRG